MNSPFPRQSQIVSPVKQEALMVATNFKSPSGLDPTTLSRSNWQTDTMIMEETIDFGKPMYEFDTYGNFDHGAMMLDPITVNDPAMPDWNTPNDLDFSSFINNQVGA